MEVGIRQGVCNNSPAEVTSPENGWRCSVVLILRRQRQYNSATVPRVGRRREALTSRRVAAVSAEGLAARPSGAAAGADLGGSSKYSSETLED